MIFRAAYSRALPHWLEDILTCGALIDRFLRVQGQRLLTTRQKFVGQKAIDI